MVHLSPSLQHWNFNPALPRPASLIFNLGSRDQTQVLVFCAASTCIPTELTFHAADLKTFKVQIFLENPEKLSFTQVEKQYAKYNSIFIWSLNQ